MNDSKDRITVVTRVKASTEKTWEAWNDPHSIVQWYFASSDWHCPEAENDLSPGGKFRFRMEAKNGSAGFDFEGAYYEVAALKRIGYSLADGRRIDISFEKDGAYTVVRETFDPESENSAEAQRAGWQSILDNFKKFVET
jgi:uncharacterized protein YndB with AHSA1/START domain